MAEGPDASLICELVGADEGLTKGVVGAMAGDASRCSISLIFLEAPEVLEVFFKTVLAFFLKHAKSISTGIRRAMDYVGEKEAYTTGMLWQKESR